MATSTTPVSELTTWVMWELKRYEAVLPPNQRSIREKLGNAHKELQVKQKEQYKELDRMYNFMANPAKWNVLDPFEQDKKWEQFHRTLKEYEQVCDCVAGIEALRR